MEEDPGASSRRGRVVDIESVDKVVVWVAGGCEADVEVSLLRWVKRDSVRKNFSERRGSKERGGERRGEDDDQGGEVG